MENTTRDACLDRAADLYAAAASRLPEPEAETDEDDDD
jgi:hypothetical protein